jgi:vancomycin permeability regulator SanA
MLALIILLGCNIQFILNDRIETAINFVEKINLDYEKIDWFLSGGIKDKSISFVTEADKMEKSILQHGVNDNWNFIKDYKSTNTAENFKMVEKQIKGVKYSNIFVVTSEYHFERAKLFADTLIPDNEFEWVLSKKEERNSRQLEKLHLKNVMNDIEKVSK